jgi:predicted pyridoxine 5'-phosphate oxidase superfamily flavin-nucleotide-binding protein
MASTQHKSTKTRNVVMSFGKLAFTPLVKKLQELYGSHTQYARMEKSAKSQDRLTDFEKDFLAERDTFYWATTSATGWPYVQIRGGPKGFLKVIDDRTLAFADFRGNRQYITTGNLMGDDRVALILVDYPRQARLKILGHVELFEGVKAERWLPRVRVSNYKAVIERVFVIQIEAFDWNCPQHITPRYTAEEIRDAAHSIEEDAKRLEIENEVLRNELALMRSSRG